MWYEMLIFIMSHVPQNILDFVLDCCSGELDLGTLGSYSGSPFLTPDAFLRSPDKDVLGEDNDLDVSLHHFSPYSPMEVCLRFYLR